MKNALKSEMLTTHSRIMFTNIITDFMECHDQVSEEAFNRSDQAYEDIYSKTLEQLWQIKNTMNLEELI